MATQRELSRPEATSGAADLSAPGDLSSSAASFARSLRAANIAPATLKTYAEAVRTLAAFLRERGMPTDVAVITREHVEAFITDHLARWRPATAANRYRGVQRCFAWLVEEGEIRASPMAKMGKMGLLYVGQSSNVALRLLQHVATGKITPAAAKQAYTFAVGGGKTAREIAEQLTINALGGVKNLENIRNLIGPARTGLLQSFGSVGEYLEWLNFHLP